MEFTLNPSQGESTMQANTLTVAHEFIGEVNGKRYYLGPEASEPMTQEEALEWCSSLGEGFELPSRAVMLACYKKKGIRKHFKTDNYYWTCEEYGPMDGWFQSFLSGNDYFDAKTREAYVRAVRVENID